MVKKYTGYLGMFDYWWKNPPPPFNPEFRTDHEAVAQMVRQRVAQGEPYESREARSKAYREAWEAETT